MTSRLSTSPHIATIALIAAMIIWASSFIALKIAFTEVHPVHVLFARMLLAGICFMLFLKWMTPIKYQKGDWKILALMAAMEPCLYFVFESLALQNTTASQAGVVTSLLPLLTGIGAFFAFNERLSRKTWAGFAVAIFGAALLSLTGTGTQGAPNPALGNFYELIAMVCAAIYTLAVKHLVNRYSPLFLTALQAWVGTLFFGIPALFVPLPEVIGIESLSAILYLGLVVSIGAYGCYNFALTKVPATQAAAFINLIPVFTAIIAFTVLGEFFTPLQFGACGLIVAGLLISRQTRTANADNADHVPY